MVFSDIETGRSYLVKYLAENSYVPFITIFLNKLLENKPKGFLIDNSDNMTVTLMEIELLTTKSATGTL